MTKVWAGWGLEEVESVESELEPLGSDGADMAEPGDFALQIFYLPLQFLFARKLGRDGVVVR